jgi:hypothetical protein
VAEAAAAGMSAEEGSDVAPPRKKARLLGDRQSSGAAVEWRPPAQTSDKVKQPTGKFFVNDQTAHWLCGVPDVPVVALTQDPFADIVSTT